MSIFGAVLTFIALGGIAIELLKWRILRAAVEFFLLVAVAIWFVDLPSSIRYSVAIVALLPTVTLLVTGAVTEDAYSATHRRKMLEFCVLRYREGRIASGDRSAQHPSAAVTDEEISAYYASIKALAAKARK